MTQLGQVFWLFGEGDDLLELGVRLGGRMGGGTMDLYFWELN
jgi:hypothetical protein